MNIENNNSNAFNEVDHTENEVVGNGTVVEQIEAKEDNSEEDKPNFHLDPSLDLIHEFGLSKLYKRFVASNPTSNLVEGSELIPENYISMLKDFGEIDCEPEHYFEELLFRDDFNIENITFSPDELAKAFQLKSGPTPNVDVSSLGQFQADSKKGVLDTAGLPVPKLTIRPPASPVVERNSNSPSEIEVEATDDFEENYSSRSERKSKKKKKRRVENEDYDDNVDVEGLEDGENADRSDRKKKKKKKKKSKEGRHHSSDDDRY